MQLRTGNSEAYCGQVTWQVQGSHNGVGHWVDRHKAPVGLSNLRALESANHLGPCVGWVIEHAAGPCLSHQPKLLGVHNNI